MIIGGGINKIVHKNNEENSFSTCYTTGIIPSKLSKIHILIFESNLVLP
jgi:hypothetical protein